MKNLKDLKEDILANKINKFYVFYGEDFGLRKHYIDYLSKKYSKKTIVNNALNLGNSFGGGNLFKTTTLYVVPGDLDFAKLKKDKIEEFITKIDKNDCVILDYEDDITNTSLYKNFDEKVTYFPEVNDNIAQQFVESELKLDIASKEELAKNGIDVINYEMKWNQFSMKYFKQVAVDVFEKYPEIDGIYGSDMVVCACLGEAHKRKLNIPENIKFIAYDGTFITESGFYNITSIVQQIDLLAAETAKMIVSLIKGKKVVKDKILPVVLRKGDTC